MQGEREFHMLPEYILTLIIDYSYIQNKLENMNEKEQPMNLI
jgi:hypothetical protein